MDFDPHSIKWQCCCCSLPSGMRLLASFELAFCTLTAAITMFNIINRPSQDLSTFQVCLVGLMLFVAITSIMLIIGIQKHSAQLIYPSLLARGLCTLFLAVFGVSTVFAHSKNPYEYADRKYYNKGKTNQIDEPNIALRLVLFVFGMLFLTVIIFYCSYLVVRLISYEQSYAKLQERRTSLIQAGMIDPDCPSRLHSRRASSA
ncbi:unnamed protein product [Caenorhabditis bovis]|uniref:DUF7027 domain-containing protein n=1 Tax=Caenorhabditis bovis TaxID=2654633 RepID=A0A8S1F5U8_9PELO|nr:unnamed protein product [Caenorhabditis bovis]